MWGESVREILSKAKIPESRVATKLTMNRGMLHQYLSNDRSPKANVVTKVDAEVERLVGRSGVAAYLDLAAFLGGLIDVEDDEILADEALRILEDFERFGLLSDDWRERFDQYVERIDDDEFRDVIAAICLAVRKPLIDDITGKLPVGSAYAQVREKLLGAGLPEIFPKPALRRSSGDEFLTVARRELLRPPKTATERLAAEQRLMKAAWAFAESVSGLTQRELILCGGKRL